MTEHRAAGWDRAAAETDHDPFLQQLADGQNAELAEARDPRTDSARLHRLTRARDREVRRAVAGNPNTAVADLDVLARRFAVEFADNPVIDWLTLTDAEWPKELSPVSRHRVLTSTSSLSLLWWAATAGDEDDQIAAATNPQCPQAILRLLASSDEGSVAEAAVLHVANEPPPVASLASVQSAATAIAAEGELADLLAGDLLPKWLVEGLGLPSDADARRELARHRSAHADVLRDLLGDDDDQTRRLAMANPNTDPVDVSRWNRLRADDSTLTSTDLDLLAATSYGRERCAPHPRLSNEARLRCATDAAWRVRQTAAANPSLSADEAAGLAVDGDRDVRAAVAANPALPLTAVRGLQLDTDERVRAAALARLQSIGRGDGPRADSGTPGVAHPMLFEPVLARTPLQSLHRRGLALSADIGPISAAEIDLLAADDDVQLRGALAENPTAPHALLTRLSTDPDPLVRRRVAVAVVDHEVLAQLSVDGNVEVQAGVAGNPRLPPWLILRLAETASDDVRVALAGRPDAGLDTLARLLERSVGNPVTEIASHLVRRGIDATHTDDHDSPTDAPIVEDLRLLFEQHSWAALIAMRSPWFPPVLLTALRSSPNWRIRQAVAVHPNATETDLRVLAIDNDNDVRAAVAANPSVVLDDFACFATEIDEKVRRVLVGRADISVALLCVHLLGDDGIRTAAIEHPRLPTEIRDELDALLHGAPLGVDVLLRFVNTSARRLVVAHPSTPTALLREVIDDSAWTIREAIAHHPNCDPEDLRRLADDHDRDVRAAVGSNVFAPLDVLGVLVGDSDPRVRRSVIANPTWVSVDQSNRAQSVSRSLLRHESPSVRVVGLLSAGLPGSAIARPIHVRSIDWLERFAVAVHPNTPSAVRKVLASDANVIVRAGATGELSWPR